jgi:hypothetical protein
MRDKVVAEAQKLYRGAGGKSIELTFSFDATNPIRSNRMKNLSAGLAALARSVDSQGSGEIDEYLFRDMIPEISSIYLNAREYLDANWRRFIRSDLYQGTTWKQ